MASPTPAELRPVDLFDDLDDDALAEWAAAAEVRDVPADAVIVEEHADPPGLHLLLAGEVRTELLDAGPADPVHIQRAPTWMGAISSLTGESLEVRLVAHTPCRVAVVETEAFRRLAFAHPLVHRRVMRQVGPVFGFLTALERDRDRLASLGTMAAGLAHELNNPAAAAQRAAGQLREAIETVTDALGRFVDTGVEREDAAVLVALQREALQSAATRTPLDTLDAADAEEALLARMEAMGVEGAWQLAEPLAAAGVGEDWLARVQEAAGPATGTALAWVAATLSAGSLAGDLQESTRRISDLVAAVKSYAYMDRGGVVEVDIHEGLETTLTVLGHKLRHTDIRLVRDYDRDLPKLTVHGSELNQVWTNLIDNAIDALGDRGTITIRTLRDGSCIEVHVCDDGPGVPPEIADRVFDAFVTTKEVGKGTGLGLANVYRIVVERHDGSLTVDSRPGRTVFRVRLPIAQRT